MKWIARIVTLAVLIAAVFAVPSAGSCARAYASDGYEITSYDVQTVIGEDNVYDITETIHVHFTEQKHGIYRGIPVNTVFERDSGDTLVKSWVTNVRVEGYDYSVSREYGYVNIRIGDPDELITGDHTYRISYKLHFGDDGMADSDEVYYNIIGNEWTSMTDSLTFSVTLPSGFDKDSLGFSIGYEGSTGYSSSDLAYWVEGNTISGRVLRPLDAYEGVTMRMALPEEYFDISKIYIPDWILAGLLIMFVLAGTVLFVLRGIDARPVVTVEFFPPEGMTPAELGYVNDGYVDSRDVISLIIYWADQGCLAITPEYDGYRFTRLKPLPESARPYERYMFDRLFEYGPETTTYQLKNQFYRTIGDVSRMIGKQFEQKENRIFTPQSIKAQPAMGLMSVLPVILTLIVTLSRSELGVFMALIFGSMLGLFLLAPMFWFIGLLRRWRNKTRARRLAALAICLSVWAGALAIFIPLAADNAFVPLLPWIAAACTVVLALEAVFIRKRTPRGTALLGKTEGFARFIAYAEKDRIERLVMRYPHYFYHILPYAYALGITDKWAKNFEGIATPPPEWYHSDWHTTGFSSAAFSHSFTGAMGSISSNMTSSPSSSGGGSSGGGSSGGGGGGGGGGSW